MKAFLIILLLTPLQSSLALETDNYIVWGRELQDASPAINTYFRNEIESVLIQNSSKQLNCLEITALIGERFRSRLVHDNPVENHLMDILRAEQDEIFPQGLKYVPESIYRDPYRFYIPFFGLAPNIQVGGFYFGTDKLSHFASTGRIYFEEFLAAIKKGHSQKSAELAAIEWGIRDENTVHGYWASGVFSFADMEANYQGLQFYRRLCYDQKDSYLKQNADGSWFLRKKPDISHYVDGNWDESYLESYRLPGNWEKVRPVIQKEYCHLIHSTEVTDRRARYFKNSKISPSMKYLQTQKENGSVPDPSSQSLSRLCQ